MQLQVQIVQLLWQHQKFHAVRDADRIIGLLEQEDIEPPKLNY